MKIDGDTFVPWDRFKVQMDLANAFRDAVNEMVEAYGEMEKGIEDPILCHYNGLRLHNAMEDLRALVIPGYEPKYEPSAEGEGHPDLDCSDDAKNACKR